MQSDANIAVTPTSVVGHLALHYGEGDEAPARHLLDLLGCTLVDNGPSPGSDGFCTVLVDGTSANYADNVMFLSALTPEQAAVEAKIDAALHAGAADEDPALADFRASMLDKPESSSHIGIRYRTLEQLEQVLERIETAAAPGGPLRGRVRLVRYRPRPIGDAAVDAPVADRIAASPAFRGDEPLSFAPHWIQCFVTTDLCGFGILAFGSTFELDYVFDPFFDRPPSFGAPRTATT
jgi:hypothetical protein